MGRSSEFVGNELFDDLILEYLQNPAQRWCIRYSKNDKDRILTSDLLLMHIKEGNVTRESALRWDDDTYICLNNIRHFRKIFDIHDKANPPKTVGCGGCGCLLLIIIIIWMVASSGIKL